jgi:hypothetical protein
MMNGPVRIRLSPLLELDDEDELEELLSPLDWLLDDEDDDRCVRCRDELLEESDDGELELELVLPGMVPKRSVLKLFPVIVNR